MHCPLPLLTLLLQPYRQLSSRTLDGLRGGLVRELRHTRLLPPQHPLRVHIQVQPASGGPVRVRVPGAAQLLLLLLRRSPRRFLRLLVLALLALAAQLLLLRARRAAGAGPRPGLARRGDTAALARRPSLDVGVAVVGLLPHLWGAATMRPCSVERWGMRGV